MLTQMTTGKSSNRTILSYENELGAAEMRRFFVGLDIVNTNAYI